MRLRGAFPYRAPLGVITGLLLSFLLVPVYYRLTVPEVKRFYAWPYLKSAVTGTLYRGKAHLDVYQILYAGKLPVLGSNAEEASGELHTEKVNMHPLVFHEWLRQWIYPADYVGAFETWVWWSVSTFTGLLVLGRCLDLARQRRARFGMYLRGTRLVSVREFNREALR